MRSTDLHTTRSQNGKKAWIIGGAGLGAALALVAANTLFKGEEATPAPTLESCQQALMESIRNQPPLAEGQSIMNLTEGKHAEEFKDCLKKVEKAGTFSFSLR